MSDYLKFESILRSNPKVEVTELIVEPNLVRFKVNGYTFLSYGHYILHEKHPMYAHEVTDFFAAIENDPEEIERQEQVHREADEDSALFLKNKKAFVKIVMLAAIKTYMERDKDETVLSNFIEAHMDFHPTEIGMEVIRRIEEKNK